MSASPSHASLANLWPTPEQEALLKAALLDGNEALSAYWQWRRGIDLEAEFDRGTFRLLPLLYQRLQTLNLSDTLMGRLKGIYRMAWYENHRLLHDMRPTLEALQQAGIDLLLLKGVPLLFDYYRNHAVRPMADVDVVVRPEAARDAIRVLEGLGWERGETASDENLKYRHSMQFRREDGREFDLHWHFLYETCGAAADAYFWETARPLDMDGLTVRTLDPTNMLLHTIVHGIRWNPEPPIRWIADAMVILRSAGEEIDWERMVAFAKAQKLTFRLGLGLDYLARTFEAPVPADTLAALAAARTSIVERVENTCVLTDRSRLWGTPSGNLWLIFAEYCRYASRANPAYFIVGFSHYLRYRWQLKGRLEIVTVIVGGLARRTRRGVSRVTTGDRRAGSPVEHL